MAKITAITQQKRTSRVNVFIDEKFAFGLSKKTLVDFDLYNGKFLSEKEVTEILEKDQLTKAIEKSFRLLGIRPHSQKELEKKLKEKEFAPEIIEETIKRVKELGYLDDKKFAKAWLESRKLSHKGKYIVQRELKQKGVAEEIVKKTISHYTPKDEFKIALELAEKKMKTLQGSLLRKSALAPLDTKLSNGVNPRQSAFRLRQSALSQRGSAFSKKQKIARFLAGRGFSWDTIIKVLEKIG